MSTDGSSVFGFGARDCSISGLNFSTTGGKMNDSDIPAKKARMARDPMSHRIIEKRRRDRMNNSLADLSQVIPQYYLKQGHGRIEKTEIIEMAINHIKEIKMQLTKSTNDQKGVKESFWLGYKESMDEVMRYLVEIQNYNPSHKLCVDLLKHLNEQSIKYCPDQVQDADDKSQDKGNKVKIVQKSSPDSSKVAGMTEIPHGNQLMKDDRHPMNKPAFGVPSCEDSSRSLFTNLDTSDGSWSIQHEYSEVKEKGEPPPMDYVMNEGDNEMKHLANSWDSRGEEGMRNGGGVYKFKNDIKLRFVNGTNSCCSSSTGKLEQVDMDTSSINSFPYQSDANNMINFKKDKIAVPSPSSESVSSGYPNSDMSSISGNSRSGGENCVGKSSNSRSKRSSKGSGSHDNPKCVPGFALHPRNTYYIPIVISVEQLVPYLRQQDESPSRFPYHPVSIPVNFTGGQFVPIQCENKPT